MQRISKFLLLFIISFLLVANSVNAQVPAPRVPCGKDASPEFNSLRPYQASPCADSPKAYYCGNDILIYEIAHHTETSDNDDICNIDEWPVHQRVDKTYNIALKDMELPILGNTQDNFDNATKANEYVSSYLSGANAKRETGPSTDDQIVNYSGPIQKLFPSAIQDAQRIETIESVDKTVNYADAESVATNTPPKTVKNEPANHNQTVICAQGENAVACPGGDGEVKLQDFDDKKDLSLVNTLFNDIFKTTAWDKRYPPLPWQFKENIYYLKAYNEWRGKTCAIIPIINKLLCADLGIASPTQKWANLYQYIPLSSTVDKAAKVPVPEGHAEVKPIGQTEINPDRPASAILKEPVLYFAHTQEDAQLSSLLKKSFVPLTGTTKDIDPLTTEPDRDSVGKCNLINIRSNEGDNLFPEVAEGQYSVKVDPYYIEKIPKSGGCNHTTNKFGDDVYSQAFEGGATVTIKTQTKTPNSEEIYRDTVAGSSSIFRKVYPKVGPGAPVECIANIPTVSNATYEILSGTDEIKVTEPDGTSTNGEGSKLYFPYFGSVYEYFLKGIQTALRPKGYASPNPIDGKFCKPPEPNTCKISVPDSAVSPKLLGSFKSNFIDLANRWTAGSGCEGPDFNLADECYNYVASTAQKAGVNPAFALTIWLHESDASNYCFGGKSTQDFGINIPAIYQKFTDQLDAFLNMAKQKLCAGTPGFPETMAGWLSRYQSSKGVCDPKDTTAMDYYPEIRDTTWGPLTNCVKNGKFGITWPTDMSCP